MTLGAYLPLLIAVAALYVFATRPPGGVDSTHDNVNDASALLILVAGIPALAVVARSLSKLHCPAGLDASGACAETSGLDLTAAGIVGGAVAIGVAVAWLQQSRSPAAPRPQFVAPTGSRDAARVADAGVRGTAGGTGEPLESGQADRAAKPGGTVDGSPASLDALIDGAAQLVGRRPGVVFSGRSSDQALEALADVATAWAAKRFVTRDPGDPGETTHNGVSAGACAGEDAGHMGELALEIAGGAIDSVLFADESVQLSPLALGRLQHIGSVCLASDDTAITKNVRVVIRVSDWNAEGGDWSDVEGDSHPLPDADRDWPTRAEVIARIQQRRDAGS